MKKDKCSFWLQTNMVFGIGETEKLPQHLIKLGFSKIGLLLDQGLVNNQYWRQVEKELLEQFGLVARSTGPVGEPTYQYLDELRQEFMGKKFDCLIGVGGGSTLDSVKALSILITNPKPAITYRGFDQEEHAGPPVVAIPTTAGTGSEVSPNAVFTDKTEQRKLGINTKSYVPHLSILDPKMVVSCPRQVLVSSAMDAIVHTLEGFATKTATPISRMFAIQAFDLLFNALPKTVTEPDNLEWYGQLQLGAYLAIINLFNAGGGPIGALSYPLGVHFEVPHGMAGAVFLPYIVQHNVEQGYLDYAQLYPYIENVPPATSQEEASQLFATKIWNLIDTLQIPRTLEPFGVNQENLDILLEQAVSLKAAFEMNPIPFSVEDAQNLLKQMTPK